jgi:hypothetical protein
MEHQEVNHGSFRLIACPHILSADKDKMDLYTFQWVILWSDPA